jgi:hypothetical protein
VVQLGTVQVDDFIACVIRTEAQAQGCPEYIAMGIAMAESGFDPNAVGDNGCSIGLFQLNTCGGQGSDYANNKDALKDPKLNARIAIHPITVAAFEASAAGYQGEQWIRWVCAHSGHPGNVALNDPRITNIFADTMHLITNAAGQLTPWPANNPAVCGGAVPPPPPIGSWAEPLNPANKDQAQQVIEAHFQRISDLFERF